MCPLAVSGTGWPSHGGLPLGTAARPQHSQSLCQDPSLGARGGTSIPRLQLIQAAALCSPFKKGLGWVLDKSRAACQEGEARWSVEVCVERVWTPGDRDKQRVWERAALIGIWRALLL